MIANGRRSHRFGVSLPADVAAAVTILNSALAAPVQACILPPASLPGGCLPGRRTQPGMTSPGVRQPAGKPAAEMRAPEQPGGVAAACRLPPGEPPAGIRTAPREANPDKIAGGAATWHYVTIGRPAGGGAVATALSATWHHASRRTESCQIDTKQCSAARIASRHYASWQPIMTRYRRRSRCATATPGVRLRSLRTSGALGSADRCRPSKARRAGTSNDDERRTDE